MFEAAPLLTFVAASLVVLVIPGPGVAYVVARSLGQGARAGIASVIGLSLGALVHVLAAVLGLTAILMTSATAFSLIKLIGAAYLIYLGVQLIRSAPTQRMAPPPPLHLRRLVLDGVVVSIFNPKIAVFFLAFLPQFVDPDASNAAGQFLTLGLIYVGLALVTDGGYCLAASNLRHVLRARVLGSRWPQRLSGVLFILLGIGAALTGRRV